MNKEKILVIIGPTAVGKSHLAVRLAKKFRGEVISADSRQTYKGLDLGSAKISQKEMEGVPHHLLSIANPKKQFSAAEYQQKAISAIADIIKKGKIPIIVGGTGFYIDAVVKGLVLPKVPPNPKLRKELEKKITAELATELKKLDPARHKTIDLKNKVRLIRAIEVAKALGKVPKLASSPLPYEFIKIGLRLPEDTLKRKIRYRLRKRLRAGMAIEIYDLNKKGIPWKRFLELGFEQRYTTLFLRGKISEKEMLSRLLTANMNYTKRQMRWFKRDSEIKWFNPENHSQILTYCKKVI